MNPLANMPISRHAGIYRRPLDNRPLDNGISIIVRAASLCQQAPDTYAYACNTKAEVVHTSETRKHEHNTSLQRDVPPSLPPSFPPFLRSQRQMGTCHRFVSTNARLPSFEMKLPGTQPSTAPPGMVEGVRTRHHPSSGRL